jgi:phosphatidylglycerophosphatase A
MINVLNTLFVTMFGLGKIRFFPGTFGSLATIIILYICFHILKINSSFILIGLIIIFIYSFSAVTQHTKNSKNKDPGEIIIDEVNRSIDTNIPL